MESKEHFIYDKEASKLGNRTYIPKLQWDSVMSMSSLHEVKTECIDEESEWCQYEPETSYTTEYKSHNSMEEFTTLQQFKQELYDKESSIDLQYDLTNNIIYGDENKQDLVINNAGEEFYSNIKVLGESNKYQVTIKTERLEDKKEDFNVAQNSISIHYDALVTLRDVECKWCRKTFKNSYNLLIHNIEHMKLNVDSISKKEYRDQIKPQSYIKRRQSKRDNSDWYYCKDCNSLMQSGNRQRHIETVHGKEEIQCNLCKKKFKCFKYLQQHTYNIHGSNRQKLKNLNENVKCELCQKHFKHKYNLNCHIRNCHTSEKLKCEQCNGIFTSRPYLMQHIKRIHQEYGKLFACWCGKKFRTPRRLGYHKRAQHG